MKALINRNCFPVHQDPHTSCHIGCCAHRLLMPRRLDSDAARNANRTSGALEKAGPVSSDYDAYNGVQKR